MTDLEKRIDEIVERAKSDLKFEESFSLSKQNPRLVNSFMKIIALAKTLKFAIKGKPYCDHYKPVNYCVNCNEIKEILRILDGVDND